MGIHEAPSVQLEKAAFCDRLGYAYCSKCAEGRSVDRFTAEDTDTCEACGISLSRSYVEIEGTVLLESGPWKIF